MRPLIYQTIGLIIALLMGFIMNQAHAGDWKINRGEITIEGRDDLTYVWSLDQYPIRICMDKTYDAHKRNLMQKVISDLEREYNQFIRKNFTREIYNHVPFTLFVIDEPYCEHSKKGPYIRATHTPMADTGSMSGTTHMRAIQKNAPLGWIVLKPREVLWGAVRFDIERIDLVMSADANWNLSYTDEPSLSGRRSYQGVLKHELLHTLSLPHFKESKILQKTTADTHCYDQYCKTGDAEWLLFVEKYISLGDNLTTFPSGRQML